MNAREKIEINIIKFISSEKQLRVYGIWNDLLTLLNYANIKNLSIIAYSNMGTYIQKVIAWA